MSEDEACGLQKYLRVIRIPADILGHFSKNFSKKVQGCRVPPPPAPAQNRWTVDSGQKIGQRTVDSGQKIVEKKLNNGQCAKNRTLESSGQ